MIYLDSNIFIYAVLDKGGKAESCKKVLEMVSSKKTKAFTSVLTWDEVTYVLRKYAPSEEVQKQSNLFLRFPNLVFLDVNLAVLEKAEEVWKIYGLKPRDCIHTATAILNGIRQFASDDSDFDKIKELKRVKI